MSAYGHGMERQYSALSPSSGEESDMRSEFTMESVVYMSSFAAAIFIGALVTIGVILMMLLIALMAMLQSCQSRSSAVIDMLTSIDHHRYDYCKMAALHAELNNYEARSLPGFCNDVAAKYIERGHYKSDLDIAVSLAEGYFKNVTPVSGGMDLVLMDMDDLLPSWPLCHRFHHYDYDDCFREAKHLKHVFLLQLYMKLQSGGWPLVLLSREPEKHRGAILESLVAARYGGWSKLILRSDEEMKMDTREYFSKQKAAMQAEGYRVRAVISSRMDALVGPFIGTQIFKLPNPFITPTTIGAPKLEI